MIISTYCSLYFVYAYLSRLAHYVIPEHTHTLTHRACVCRMNKVLDNLLQSDQPNMGRVEVYFAGYIVESNISLVWKFSCKKNVLTEVGRQHGYKGASLSGYKIFHSEAVLP